MDMFLIVNKHKVDRYLDLETGELVDMDGFSERCLLPTEWLARQVIKSRMDSNHVVMPVKVLEAFEDSGMAIDYTTPDFWVSK